MLWPLESLVHIPHRVPHVPQHLGLLLCQLPALALGAIGTVVSAAATYKELRVISVRTIVFECPSGEVLEPIQKTVWSLLVEHVHTLGEEQGIDYVMSLRYRVTHRHWYCLFAFRYVLYIHQWLLVLSHVKTK